MAVLRIYACSSDAGGNLSTLTGRRRGTEAAKADKADDGRVARLIDGLVDLVPAAIGAVTSIFATPLLGNAAGTATRFVLDKLNRV